MSTSDSTSIAQSRFLRTCRRQPTDATPIWLMRQAGRYMPEYRQMRTKYSILEMIKTPELACEVTLQPLQAFDLDAAIIFADILPPLEGLGLKLEFVNGEGPRFHNPIRSLADIEQLKVPDVRESCAYTLEAIKLVQREITPRGIPLLGFSGAPFTLAAYAIEGQGSRNYIHTKTLMGSHPEHWHQLMGHLAQLVGQYLLAQAQVGAQALQIFDSWVGALSPADYQEFVLPYTRQAIQIARQAHVPIIHFGTGTNGMLELLRETGCDVMGVDWCIDLDIAWKRIGSDWAIQGNLDPVALFSPWDAIKKRAQQILDKAAVVNPRRTGHIFNLGHGILPETPVDHVRRLIDFVHEATSQSRD